ncbi:MAG: cholesterol transport system auxiliary component [Sulfurimonas sp.]|jgi:cholesterol transport system auxiliary component
MIKLYVGIIMILLLAGCSTTNPSVTEYRLSVKALDYKSSSNGCEDKSIKVSQAFSSNSLMEVRMSYVQDEQKIYSYSQAQWNNSPNQEISSQIAKALRDSKLFKNTQTSKSRSNSDLILEANIEDFMQYFTQDSTKSYVKVMISFTLIDSKTSEVIATKTFNAKRNVTSLDALGGVKALDAALHDVLEQGILFLNEVCL